MFESIVVRKQGFSNNKLIDLGLVAEAILFYQKVHVLFDFGSLQFILKTIGAENILALVEQNLIQASFLPDQLGVATTNAGISYHNFIKSRLNGTKDGRRFDRTGVISVAFERALGKSKETEAAATRFLSHVSFSEKEDLKVCRDGILGMVQDDLNDPEYVKKSVEIVLQRSVPDYKPSPSWHFNVTKMAKGFITATNLDLNSINEEYRKKVSPLENTLTPAWFLDAMLEARGDMFFASNLMSELMTDPIRSDIIKLRFSNLMKKRDQNVAEIELFQEINLADAHAIRGALNSGEASFSDFLKLMEKARKFKDWLQKEKPNQQLLEAYLKSATSETWVDKLPTKGVRFAIFSGAGIILDALLAPGVGTTTGLALSATDTLLLDKLIKGWRPNMFVEGPLKDFIKASNP